MMIGTDKPPVSFSIGVHGQHSLKRLKEWDNAILATLALINPDLAVVEINIGQLDIDQLAYPTPGI
ncbi:hypothetical protein D3C74_329020 [compost metagenome]